jgi:hypothetical protein
MAKVKALSFVIGFVACIFVILASGIQTITAGVSIQFHAAVLRQNISAAKKTEILKSIQGQQLQYNVVESMIWKIPHGHPHKPHTTWKGGNVHPIRDAAVYAVLLLDNKDKAMKSRAFTVLSKALLLQNIKMKQKRIVVIWPYFLEAPLDKMASPDWIWAAFISAQLLRVIINQRQRVPLNLPVRFYAAIIHAARVIQRRNIGPSYTDIAIMGTHATLTWRSMHVNVYGHLLITIK